MRTPLGFKLSVLMLALLGVALVGCHKEGPKEAAAAIFDKQAKAMATGDVESYMSTIDPDSPAYAPTKALMTALGGKKLVMTVDKIDLVSESDTEAQVRTVITTKAPDLPRFKANTITALNTLKKVNGKWLLSGSKQEDMKFL